jgi:hypothetical protein
VVTDLSQLSPVKTAAVPPSVAPTVAIQSTASAVGPSRNEVVTGKLASDAPQTRYSLEQEQPSSSAQMPGGTRLLPSFSGSSSLAALRV